MSIIEKKVLIFFMFISIGTNIFAAGKQSSQIIQSGHWIYDDLELLSAESKTTMFLENQPLSVGEINFYLKNIDYSILSGAGKAVYERVVQFLEKDDDFFDNDSLRLFLNFRTNPEFFYKSNPDLSWSFSYNFKDKPITFPIIIGFSDNITIQSDLALTKDPNVVKKHNNFSNISFDIGEYDLYLPDFAYFSGTKVFDTWGISSHLGKEGMKIGNTSIGSIIYNDTFKSDFYSQLNFFTNRLKFSMDVTQFNKDKYMYNHHLTLRPFKNFNISVLEGSLITAPFELRFLNPLMIMHSFLGWNDYDNNLNAIYGESNFCAYLAFTIEYFPIPNLRLYGLYAQNEITDFDTFVTKNPSQYSLSWPNSLGAQIGAEYFIPLENKSHIKTGIEVLYTSPFLYVKHSPVWSLIRTERAGSHNLASWLGAPTGPDSFIVQANVDYDSNEKWDLGFEYDFSIHGENTAYNLFNKKKYFDPKGHWTYYPSVEFKESETEAERNAAVKKSMNMWMTGTPEYKNELKFKGNYKILENLELSAQFIYTFVFNNLNILNNFDQGVELAIALTYEFL